MSCNEDKKIERWEVNCKHRAHQAIKVAKLLIMSIGKFFMIMEFLIGNNETVLVSIDEFFITMSIMYAKIVDMR